MITMKTLLFDMMPYNEDRYHTAKSFFNSLHSQHTFVLAVSTLVRKIGYVSNAEYCVFPDYDDPDPAGHFSGVAFGMGDNEVVVTCEEFETLLRKACDAYVQARPDDRQKIVEAYASAGMKY